MAAIRASVYRMAEKRMYPAINVNRSGTRREELLLKPDVLQKMWVLRKLCYPMDDLAAMVKAGNMPFDVVIAAPDAMRVVGTLGQILGPRGLMPNPKVGTVTPDVATAVRNAKAGQVQFRVDKAGIVHGTIGRRSFDNDKLQGNLAALVDALVKAKPATSKGLYLRSQPQVVVLVFLVALLT